MNDNDNQSAISRITGMAARLGRRALDLDTGAVLEDARKRAVEARTIISQELRLAREDFGRSMQAVRDYQTASTDDLAALKKELRERADRATESVDEG